MAMKTSMWQFAAILHVCFPPVGAHRTGFLNSNSKLNSIQAAGHMLNDRSVGGGNQAGQDEGQESLKTALDLMVGAMLEGNGPTIRDITSRVHRKMGFKDAMRQLDGKLPTDVAALVRLTGSDNGVSRAAFNEESLQKARRILNGMMLSAWKELDDVVIDYKEFQSRNRGTYEQVVADLARLGSQLAKLGEQRVSASQGIMEADRKRKTSEEQLEIVTQQFTATRFENSRELSIRKNDLAVFDFVFNATACQDKGLALVQRPVNGRVRICTSKEGTELNFNDPQLQAKVERMMTPDARLALREALGQAVHQFNFVQVQQEKTVTAALPTFAADVLPVAEAPHPGDQWKKCLDGTPNCGLLHDLMSFEWGKFRDSFDELTAEMLRNQQSFDTTARNINDELTVINEKKTKQMEILANTISSINAGMLEMSNKDEQKRALTKEFDNICKTYRDKIGEILFTKICAVRKVRNELLVNSKLTPPSNFSDCDFSDWKSKNGECIAPSGKAILCDDTCSLQDPYKCGGMEMLTRDIVVLPDAHGMKCPQLERQIRCGQKTCPVDCQVSEWSGWSKCTKDCEGGVQAKTRSILVKPKNGGMGCDAVQEDRPCNTGSCDRDCALEDWTAWAPCSAACGGGITTRERKVLIPIRGQGRCPTQNSRNRFAEKACNAKDCVGDEVCIAQQDLILLVDASGSLKEDGYQTLRDFAVNLTKHYNDRYFGLAAMKMGVGVFGNGELLTLPDGSTTIKPAINIQSLTTDFDTIRKKMSAVGWQRGFTNMAQGFTLADTMLSQGGRPEAQSAVMVLSDGRYSFKYQTAEKAQELKDKNVKIFMVPVTDSQGDDLEVLKDWASQPWEAHYQHIPGHKVLKFNAVIFIQKLIAKFCPDVLSPTVMRSQENARQFMLIHEEGWPNDSCGQKAITNKVASKEDCAQIARQASFTSFAFGEGLAEGRCYLVSMEITEDYWSTYQNNRKDPPCPNGGWSSNPLYNTYAINPVSISRV